MYRTMDGWIDEYRRKGALWIHDGNAKRPHALLTSGKHSSGFFNSRLVIPDEVLLRFAADDLLIWFSMKGGNVENVGMVVGPQTGATKLAEYMSDQVTAYTQNLCYSASPAKSEKDGVKSMVFSEEELALLPGMNVLLCEDVLTTGGSIELTEAAVLAAGGFVLPYVAALVNRSGLATVSGKKIISLIERPMPMWASEECPLCKAGSQAIPAKGEENWARLNACY